MNREEVVLKIKNMLIERLMLEESVDEIKNDMPLFDSEAINKERESDLEVLGLDSVDALEIMVGIQEIFNIKVDSEKNPQVFYSVNTLADYVMQHTADK